MTPFCKVSQGGQLLVVRWLFDIAPLRQFWGRRGSHRPSRPDFSLQNGHRDIAHPLLLGFGSSLEAQNKDQRKLEPGQ